MNQTSIEQRIGSLEKKTRPLRYLCWLQTLILAAIAFRRHSLGESAAQEAGFNAVLWRDDTQAALDGSRRPWPARRRADSTLVCDGLRFPRNNP